MYEYYNPNPFNKIIGDCVIRAICKVTDEKWNKVYLDICNKGYFMKDMPSSNSVWGACLKDKGYIRHVIPNYCPDCYSVKDFCKDNPKGKFILCLDGHVVAVINGTYFDTWDSGDEVPHCYWTEAQQ